MSRATTAAACAPLVGLIVGWGACAAPSSAAAPAATRPVSSGVRAPVSPHGPAPGPRSAHQQLAARLLRSDGVALSDVTVPVRCADGVHRVRTDAQGVLRLTVARRLRCALHLEGVRYRLGGRRVALGLVPWRTIALPPAVGLSLRWRWGKRSGLLDLTTRLPSPVEVGRRRYGLTRSHVTLDGRPVLRLAMHAKKALGVAPYVAKPAPFDLAVFAASQAQPKRKWGELKSLEAKVWALLEPALRAREVRLRNQRSATERRWLAIWRTLKQVRKVAQHALALALFGLDVSPSAADAAAHEARWWRQERLLYWQLQGHHAKLRMGKALWPQRSIQELGLLAAALQQTLVLGRLASMMVAVRAAEVPPRRLAGLSRGERRALLQRAYTLWLLANSAPRLDTPRLPKTYLKAALSLMTWVRKMPLGTPLTVEVAHLARRAYVPVALRGPPRADAVGKLLVRSGARVRALTGLLGQRTALLVTPCKRRRKTWRRALARLAEQNVRGGKLVVAVALSDVCATHHRRPGVWQSNAELPWALGLDPSTPALVLLDGKGVALWRLRVGDPKQLPAEVAALQAELEHSWPPFAAARRVSVEKARSVRGARLRRLLALAHTAEQKGQLTVARRYAAAAVRFDPESSAARRRLTLVAARQRDIVTALAQLRWWEQRFGALAEDVLRDDAKAVMRPVAPDPGRGTAP